MKRHHRTAGRVHPRHWRPGAPAGDVLADVHVPVPPSNRADPDAVLADVWEEVPRQLRVAEAEEIADDIRHLRTRPNGGRGGVGGHRRLALLVVFVIVAVFLLVACEDAPEPRSMT